jgi:hypothetical protein
MKLISFLFVVLSVLSFRAYSQYLPTTGGTITGMLTITGGNQLQMPYLGFNSPYAQPATSSNVSIFANSSSAALDIVGFSNGWHFVPSSTTKYPSPVAGIDPLGNAYFLGNLGLGTSAPSSQLTLGSLNSINPNSTGNEINYSSLTFQNSNAGNNYLIGRISAVQEKGNYIDAGAMVFYTGVAGLYERMRINTNGNLLVGKAIQANTSYKLDVNGNIRGNAITVNTTGADFVFQSNYKLWPLAYLENYIVENHHLPDIATAKEMQTNGLDLGENETKLLQKIEELTLYLIEKDKQLSHTEAVNTKQQNEIEQNKQQILLLQANMNAQKQFNEILQKEIDELKNRILSVTQPGK